MDGSDVTVVKGDGGDVNIEMNCGCGGGGGNGGAVGPQGPQGDTGPQGPQGHQGPQGEKGDMGPQGPQGETGPAGPQGDMGPEGPQGPDGAEGPEGPQGPQGEKGEDGKSAFELAQDAGFTGTEAEWLASLKGEKGDAGDTGPQGPEGPEGPQGPQGEKGEKGEDGDLILKEGGFHNTDRVYTELYRMAHRVNDDGMEYDYKEGFTIFQPSNSYLGISHYYWYPWEGGYPGTRHYNVVTGAYDLRSGTIFTVTVPAKKRTLVEKDIYTDGNGYKQILSPQRIWIVNATDGGKNRDGVVIQGFSTTNNQRKWQIALYNCGDQDAIVDIQYSLLCRDLTPPTVTTG